MAALASTAIESTRLRNLLDAVRSALNSLRALPATPANVRQACTLLFSTSRLLARLKAATAMLADQTQRAMWAQRASWIQEECVRPKRCCCCLAKSNLGAKSEQVLIFFSVKTGSPP